MCRCICRHSAWTMLLATLARSEQWKHCAAVRRGGSWLVRVSLVQTAHWLKRLGRFGIRGRGDAGFVSQDVIDLTMETESPFGTIRHLAPAITMSETPSRWIRPPVPLTTNAPAWPDMTPRSRNPIFRCRLRQRGFLLRVFGSGAR